MGWGSRTARLLPGVSIKSPELNALHISQIQGMVNLNGERSNSHQVDSGHNPEHRGGTPCAG
jgi:hypothetical protein